MSDLLRRLEEAEVGTRTHYGDPCIHCKAPHDEVASGPCSGDPRLAVVISYAALGVRPDGVERYRYRLSTNEVHEVYAHVSQHAPYYHFGRSAELIQPPRYNASLRQAATKARSSSDET